MTAPAYAKSGDLYLGNSHAVIVALERYDTAIGRWAALQGATVTVDLTTGGETPEVDGVVVPETDVPGTYAVTITATVIDGAFVEDDAVSQVVRVGGAAVFTTPLTVKASRYTP